MRVALVAALGPLALLLGCAEPELVPRTSQLRAASFASGVAPEEAPAARRLLGSTMIVLVGGTVGETREGQETSRITWSGGEGLGTAAAVTSDGYLLTAAHVVRRGPLLVLGQFQGGAAARPARLVWSSEAADLALLKVDARCAPLTLCGPDEVAAVRQGTPLVGAGAAPTQEQGERRRRLELFAGRVIEPPGRSNAPGAARTVVHDLPTWHGDSGGPVVISPGRAGGPAAPLVAGHLLAVETEGTFRIDPITAETRWISGTAVVPDRACIEAEIARDRGGRGR